MTPQDTEHLAAHPLVAILRGVRPTEVVDIGREVIAAGIRTLEVPLNSPEPFDSIRLLVAEFGDEALIGAGTVLTAHDVQRTLEAGGRLLVSPNTDPGVITYGSSAGAVCLPGFETASEAFTALAAGAIGLKLFPAEAKTPAYLKALKAVLPADTPVFPVGGISPETMPAWREAGAAGFGLGSGLYKPGMGAREVGDKARAYVAAFRDI
ncbi:2-dehydro-3-deoxy-6-phosphogalactonate aldolase [Caulobacter sp. X]|uniref:2-dehydro-3-deoxy-6-phosphogalactonate aldolase n=1 Tax=Caulobacter sp. X TaxID=2048901 RepID=UPI000C150A80|nr:2-dehydro-3-deoxy-6-phosphogalactonate aldolase [Caulobacter sp. X]PIB95227.1 2-dehydro-3-deoxy-6-phosphogalactonate aldolase [Caulobacter sp. X]